MAKSRFGNVVYESEKEQTARGQLLDLFRQCPIPDDEIMSNLGLFLNSKLLSRILFLHHIYTQIVDIPGVIIEFGTCLPPCAEYTIHSIVTGRSLCSTPSKVFPSSTRKTANRA